MPPNSRATTKTQSILVITIVVLAALGGSASYFLLNSNSQTSKEPIRIGISCDLDNTIGKGIWQAALLAAEEVNAEGGILGRTLSIVGEDDDTETAINVETVSNAMTRLITVDKADFVTTNVATPDAFWAQESICTQQKKIMFTTSAAFDEYTQKVLDDYDTHKYFFKLSAANSTAQAAYFLDSAITLGKYSGFTKVALLFQDAANPRKIMALLNSSLPQHGFKVVYCNTFPLSTLDFTSYLSGIEESGAQMLITFVGTRATIAFSKEWHDRESPFIVFGFFSGGADPEFWGATEGKCEYITTTQSPFISGYDLTNKSGLTRDAYLKRWGMPIPTGFATATYDGIRYVLPDAIKRAGTTETQAVIKALETIDVETTLARHFAYTPSHDIMYGLTDSPSPPENYQLMGLCQWQANNTKVIVFPESLMIDAGAKYMFPTWQGPWTERTP